MLKLGESNSVWIDIKKDGKMVGRMKIEYKYILAIPVFLLYTVIKDDVKVHI